MAECNATLTTASASCGPVSGCEAQVCDGPHRVLIVGGEA